MSRSGIRGLVDTMLLARDEMVMIDELRDDVSDGKSLYIALS